MPINGLKGTALYVNGTEPAVPVLSEGTESIRGYAFSSVSRLRSVTFPEGLIFIGARAFPGSDGFTGFSPDSLEFMWEGAFSCCDDLTNTAMPPRPNTEAIPKSRTEYKTRQPQGLVVCE